MTSVNISLPDEIGEYLDNRVHASHTTPSHFVEELIRDDQRRNEQLKLGELLREGLDSGPGMPADEQFWKDLKQQALAEMLVRRANA